MQTYNIENELVAQKNKILSLVNDERFEEAAALLNFVAELWTRCDYGYKLREVRERISRDLKERAMNAAHPATASKWARLHYQICE